MPHMIPLFLPLFVFFLLYHPILDTLLPGPAYGQGMGGDGLGNGGPCPDVHPCTDLGVPDVGQVFGLGPRADPRFFHLHEVAYLCALLQLTVGAQVCEGAHDGLVRDPARGYYGAESNLYPLPDLGIADPHRRADRAPLADPAPPAQIAVGESVIGEGCTNRRLYVDAAGIM